MPTVQYFFQQGLAPSTQKTYRAATKRFYSFCTAHNVLNPFPLSEQLLCFFASYLALQNLSPQTIKSYLSAIRSVHISLGFPDPRDQSSMPRLKRVQAGISRVRAQSGIPKRVRLPITLQVLSGIGNFLQSSSHPEKIVLWAVACTAFFGFFRLGELLPENATSNSGIVWGDVAIDSHSAPRMVQIHLRTSKCDQFGAGSDIVLGATGSSVCPVKAILTYTGIRGSEPGAFFRDTVNRVVTKPWFVTQIRQILKSIGLPQHNFAGHSFRIGAATTAALVGMEDSMIQTLGRWHSSAFLLYLRTPKERLAALSASLGRSTQQSH